MEHLIRTTNVCINLVFILTPCTQKAITSVHTTLHISLYLFQHKSATFYQVSGNTMSGFAS